MHEARRRTVGELEGVQVELVAGAQPRLGEQLVHGHDQVSLRHAAHTVQHLLQMKQN